MQATLGQHPELAILGETHYFDDLRVRFHKKVDQPLTPEDERTCEDYFLALSHRPYGHSGDPE